MSQFSEGTSVAYSIVPVIPTLEEPLRTQVRVAFADSLRILWFVMIGIGGLGLLSSLMMRGLSLKRETDEKVEHSAQEGSGDSESVKDQKESISAA